MTLWRRFEEACSRFAQWASLQIGKPHTLIIVLAYNVWFEIFYDFGWLSDAFVNSVGARTGNVSLIALSLLQTSTNREGTERKLENQELIRANKDARNEFLGLSHKTTPELEEIARELANEGRKT